MEQTLLQLEKERNSVAPWQVKVKNVQSLVAASSAVAEALRQAASSFSEESQVNAEWLLDVCSTVPSELGAPQLARAIWSASQQTDEAQQQAALFDALGEGGMEVLFQVAEKLPQIRQIPESDLRESPTPSFPIVDATIMDPEEARRQKLVQEARDAAHVAAIAKAEADSMAPTGGNVGTHTVTRTSEVEAQKVAKKAQKRADAALEAARKAGAILEETDFDCH
jgi:hypothetical protein